MWTLAQGPYSVRYKDSWLYRPWVVTIYMGKWETQLENQMIFTIPFRKLQKIWAVIWGNAIHGLSL